MGKIRERNLESMDQKIGVFLTHNISARATVKRLAAYVQIPKANLHYYYQPEPDKGRSTTDKACASGYKWMESNYPVAAQAIRQREVNDRESFIHRLDELTTGT